MTKLEYFRRICFLSLFARFLIDSEWCPDWLFQIVGNQGKEHIRAEPSERHRWCFSDCGLYAAAIERDKGGYKWWLRMVICTVDYFYWFNEDIITIQISQNSVLFTRLKLDHKLRAARIVQYRSYTIPQLRTHISNDEREECQQEGEKKKHEKERAKQKRKEHNKISLVRRHASVYNIGFVTIRGVEYIPLFDYRYDRVAMLPRDPESTESIRVSVYRHRESGMNHRVCLPFHGVSVQNEYDIFPIIYGQSVYFLKTVKYGNIWNNKVTRVLDNYLEVDLSKLKNVAGRLIDIETVLLNQGRSATREITLNHVATDALSEFHTTAVTHLIPHRNGQVYIPVKMNQISPWQPTFTDEYGLQCSEQAIFHPGGYFVGLCYVEGEDGSYRLTCRPVQHPNKINPLCYNERATNILERTDMVIPMENLDIVRRVL